MIDGLGVLAITAVSLGVVHTLTGPDHYIPFIAMAEARKWNLFKTMSITFFSGIGHILSSVVIGLVGISIGSSLEKFKIFENVRGEIASWLFIAFGLVYLIYGIKKAVRKESHEHKHCHLNISTHSHVHSHNDEHLHLHVGGKKTLSNKLFRLNHALAGGAILMSGLAVKIFKL